MNMNALSTSLRRRASFGSLAIFALVSTTLIAHAALAEAQGQTDGSRSMGLAGAFIANASGNGALYNNPAGVGTTLMYAFEGQYLYTPGMNTFNASVVDSKINPQLAMGFAYSYEDSTIEDYALSGHDFRLALAHQLIPSRLVLGLGGRYLLYDVGDTEALNAFALVTGVVLKASDGLFIGLSANNLIDVCDGKGEACIPSAAPRSVGTGIALGSSFGLQLIGQARANLDDVENPEMTWTGGVEFLAAQILALRAGYSYLQQSEASVLAGGIGFRSSTVGLDLAYEHNLENNEYRLSVALQLYVMSDGR